MIFDMEKFTQAPVGLDIDQTVSDHADDISNLADGMGIVANGNAHAAVANGQAVFVKNHSSLADGLYWAKASIAANAALSTSNLTPDDSGGLNKLKTEIDALNSNLNNNTVVSVRTITSGITIVNGGYTLVGKLVVLNVRITVDNDITGVVEVLRGFPNSVSSGTNNIVPVLDMHETPPSRIFLTYDGKVQSNDGLKAGMHQIHAAYVLFP